MYKITVTGCRILKGSWQAANGTREQILSTYWANVKESEEDEISLGSDAIGFSDFGVASCQLFSTCWRNLATELD